MMITQALLLIAEDDPDDQYFLQEAIAIVCPREVEPHFVLDGSQMLKLLRDKRKEAHRRTLVVLDLNMRVKDGRTTLMEIKTDPTLAGIGVVVLTTSTNEKDLEYCRHYGADYYRKPDSIVELVQILRTLYRAYLQ